MHYETVEMEIHVSELRLGMHVVRLDKPWEQTDFLLQGFVIHDRHEIEALQNQCEHVIIEGRIKRNDPEPPAKEKRRGAMNLFAKVTARKTEGQPASKKKPRKVTYKERHNVESSPRINYINKIDTNREMGQAKSAYDNARSLASNIMTGIRLGRTLDMNQAREVVDECVESILRNDDALMWLTKIKHQDEYTAEHCLNVSILSAAFGKRLGLLEEEIKTVGLCGLLHDVGKSRIPLGVLNKPGALTPAEFKTMQDHTIYGRDILMSMPRVNHATIDVAYNHHERMDGSGYPRGLSDHQIPYFAKIVALADTYDAITSNRVYDNGRASMDALDIIYRFRDSQFDRELANEFIRLVGIYPPGSIVELTNGEVGIIISSNPKNKLKPKVILVRDSAKQKRFKQKIVDLMSNAVDGTGTPYKIAKEIPNGTYDIHLQKFLEDGLILGHQTIDQT